MTINIQKLQNFKTYAFCDVFSFYSFLTLGRGELSRVDRLVLFVAIL